MKKVLLVEDNLDLSSIYETLLTTEGFSVVTAREKEEALNLAVKENISLILLDIMLAVKTSGLDLLKDLKEMKVTKNIPVVVLTNVASDEDKKEALKLGAKEYLVKANQDPQEVIDVVKKYTAV